MKQERSGREAYPDIIDLPHWQSPKRKHMSLYDRAAQFSPFAALSGYDDMIEEEERETNVKREQQIDLLNMKLGMVSNEIDAGRHPFCSFSVFIPDKKKSGGRYENIEGVVKKVDMFGQSVILSSGAKFPIDHIHDIHGELVDHIDEEIL